MRFFEEPADRPFGKPVSCSSRGNEAHIPREIGREVRASFRFFALHWDHEQKNASIDAPALGLRRPGSRFIGVQRLHRCSTEGKAPMNRRSPKSWRFALPGSWREIEPRYLGCYFFEWAVVSNCAAVMGSRSHPARAGRNSEPPPGKSLGAFSDPPRIVRLRFICKPYRACAAGSAWVIGRPGSSVGNLSALRFCQTADGII